MTEKIERELIRCIANLVPEREFIYYILSVLEQDIDREELINYLQKRDTLTKQDIIIKAMDIKQRR